MDGTFATAQPDSPFARLLATRQSGAELIATLDHHGGEADSGTVEGGISPSASVCIDRPNAGMAAEHRRLASVRWEMRRASRM